MDTNYKQIINQLLCDGGKIISVKKRGSSGCNGGTVIIKSNNCFFKIGYLNLGDRQITVHSLCSQNNQAWRCSPEHCLMGERYCDI